MESPHIRMKQLQITAWICVVSLGVAGCKDKPELAPLSGKVTYKGKALEFGSIMLQPVAGGQYSRADIQSDGTFSLVTADGEEGATIGMNRIRVSCFPAQKPGAATVPGEEVQLGKSLIPEVYNNFSSSELTVDVLPENNPPLIIDLTD